jgi:hypothetical protein
MRTKEPGEAGFNSLLGFATGGGGSDWGSMFATSK